MTNYTWFLYGLVESDSVVWQFTNLMTCKRDITRVGACSTFPSRKGGSLTERQPEGGLKARTDANEPWMCRIQVAGTDPHDSAFPTLLPAASTQLSFQWYSPPPSPPSPGG